MKPLNITLRLAAAFCLLTVVFFVVGWQGISHLRQLNAQMQNIVYQQWKEEQLADKAMRLSDLNSRITLLIFLVDDPNEIQRLLVQRAANTQRISDLVSAIEPLLEPGKETEMLAAVKATRTRYIESYQRALALLLTEHKRDEARKMMVDVVWPNLNAYHDAWNAFDQHQVEQIEQIERQNKADFATGQRDFLLMLTLAGLITGTIAIYTVLRMNREMTISHHARQSLQQARDELEVRVVGRTADLAKSNERLQAENAERKRTEELLHESEEKFRQLADNITDVFWMTSPDLQKVHYVSPAYEQVWGRSTASVYAHPQEWSEAILPEERERVYATFSRLATDGPSVSVEFCITRPDGTVRWILSRGFQVRDAAGKVIRIAGIASDITERKRVEVQIFQSQKMETVGKLAGGIAHEFNSILTAIIGQSELLLGDLPAGSPLTENVTEISKAAGRAATLTRQLLAYGRKQFLQPEILDLNAILAGMENTLLHLMGRGVEVRFSPEAGLKPIKADAGQIEQVIVNIATNATEAMPNGGKLTLETANVTLADDYVRHFPELKAGEYSMLAITDTGAGMSEEIRARIFEPFFTTKGVGKGTGLGLATCHGIIKQSSGHIIAYSELGRGTSFKIYLPQVGTQTALPIPRHDLPDLPRGTETILLVEDDPALRDMAGTLLRRLGYTVLAAANGIEALSLKQLHGIGQIDLLFTDVVMPHMSGKELADRVRALHPHTRILFTSAYTEYAIVHQGVLDKGVALLQKPFTPSALAHKLREVLDQLGAQTRANGSGLPDKN
jgi:PAS domain S-box-containing protein